jgi:hypothetical protein
MNALGGLRRLTCRTAVTGSRRGNASYGGGQHNNNPYASWPPPVQRGGKARTPHISSSSSIYSCYFISLFISLSSSPAPFISCPFISCLRARDSILTPSADVTRSPRHPHPHRRLLLLHQSRALPPREFRDRKGHSLRPDKYVRGRGNGPE